MTPSIARLLLELQTRDVRVWQTERGTLGFDAPDDAITTALEAALKSSKLDLLAALADPARAAREVWQATVEHVAGIWQEAAHKCRAAGQEPPSLDEATDADLHAQVTQAIRSADLSRALEAINRWRKCWTDLLAGDADPARAEDEPRWVEIDSSVLGEHVLVATTAEAVSAARAARPGLVVYGPAEIEHLHGIEDATILKAVHTSKKALGARTVDPRLANRVVDESAGQRPPPNPGVHAMLERGHERFGFRAQAERSLTVWLRLHRPEVAALWPEAPVDAAWIDWRGHVGPEAVPALDEAFRIVNRVDFGQHMSPRPAAVVGPASSPVELTGQSAPERRQP